MRRKNRSNNIGPVHVILFLGCLFLLPGLFIHGIFFIPLVILAALIPTFIRNAKGGEAPPVRPQAVPGGNTKDCPNPEPHRHFERARPCPNPEPHRHFTAVQQPLRQSEQDEMARRKRLENMRVLYEAGILTKEEFDYEVKRIKG
ncbi:MAG: hypothetical protein HFF08_08565 [Oscillospiraceae bacterium]|nr:hypothetical protein [Oscillospiraceae bacterium]